MKNYSLYKHLVNGVTYKTLSKVSQIPAHQLKFQVERYCAMGELTNPLTLRQWLKAAVADAERSDLYSEYQIKDNYQCLYYVRKKGALLLKETPNKKYPALAEELKRFEPSLTWGELASFFGVLEFTLSNSSLLIDYGVSSEPESWITTEEEMFEARKGGLGWKIISEFCGLTPHTVIKKVQSYSERTDRQLPESIPYDSKTKRRAVYHLSNALSSWEEVATHGIYSTPIACQYASKHYAHYEAGDTPDDMPMAELTEEILMRAEEVEQAQAELEELIKVRDERRTLISQG